MKKTNKIIPALTAIALIFTPLSYASSQDIDAKLETKTIATEKNLSFDDISKMAIENSEEIKLQSKIVTDLEKPYKEYIKNPMQNSPIIIQFEGIEQYKTYSGMRTKDFEKLYEDNREKLKNFKINNEEKTLKLFSETIRLENTVSANALKLEEAKAKTAAEKSKLNSGQITKTMYELAQLEEKNVQIEHTSSINNLALKKSELARHMGLKNLDGYKLILEPSKNIESPEIALEKIKNNKEFKDIDKEIKDLNEHLDKIFAMQIGPNFTQNMKDQQKKIDERKKDYKELEKNTYFDLKNTALNIKIVSNLILTDALDLKINENNEQKNQQLYKNGLITKIQLNSIKIERDEIMLSILEKKLQIKKLINSYENSIL